MKPNLFLANFVIVFTFSKNVERKPCPNNPDFSLLNHACICLTSLAYLIQNTTNMKATHTHTYKIHSKCFYFFARHFYVQFSLQNKQMFPSCAMRANHDGGATVRNRFTQTAVGRCTDDCVFRAYVLAGSRYVIKANSIHLSH